MSHLKFGLFCILSQNLAQYKVCVCRHYCHFSPDNSCLCTTPDRCCPLFCFPKVCFAQPPGPKPHEDKDLCKVEPTIARQLHLKSLLIGKYKSKREFKTRSDLVYLHLTSSFIRWSSWCGSRWIEWGCGELSWGEGGRMVATLNQHQINPCSTARNHALAIL